ncbi:hypothetical protein EMIT0111MI5_11194 [Burkholderia sp. IT-111MI5]
MKIITHLKNDRLLIIKKTTKSHEKPKWRPVRRVIAAFVSFSACNFPGGNRNGAMPSG